jgi:hypothetical protein
MSDYPYQHKYDDSFSEIHALVTCTIRTSKFIKSEMSFLASLSGFLVHMNDYLYTMSLGHMKIRNCVLTCLLCVQLLGLLPLLV